MKVKVKSLSRVRLLVTPWTAAYRAPLSVGFSGKSTGVGCYCLLPILAKYCLFGQKKHRSVIKNAQMVSLNGFLLTI